MLKYHRIVSWPRLYSARIISTNSIRVASSASALKLLTRFDTGQRRR
jgi:hypothetical protein